MFLDGLRVSADEGIGVTVYVTLLNGKEIALAAYGTLLSRLG